ncbi:hypothetical protein EBT31_12775 [bacterium]|nr:hypothetical protein [bacterium]
MAIYLGTFGRVTLQRKSAEGAKTSIVNPSDVNTARKRFSFDFESGFLITGDQVEITSTNGATLSWVSTAGWADGIKQSNGKWFVNIDELGGIRLYSDFSDALAGLTSTAIALDAIASDIPIRVVIANARPRMLGCITSYELNTSREAVDITALSEQFRSQYSSLMSGSGRISCQWDYKDCSGTNDQEVAHYLLQLALRTEIGSDFSAQLFLKQPGYNPSGEAGTSADSIYYDVNGLITASAVQFSPGTIVEMTADFITTGPIRLLTLTSPEYKLLQESGDQIRLEQDPAASLLLEAD